MGYKQVAPKKNNNGICHIEYTPLRDGGQFAMPDVYISSYFVLGEMTYQEMMAVKLMCAVNKHRLALVMKAVAQGSLERELSNLHVARRSYDSAVGKSKCSAFCQLSTR